MINSGEGTFFLRYNQVEGAEIRANICMFANSQLELSLWRQERKNEQNSFPICKPILVFHFI